jgi:ABC-2 type transport system ATP-binding protein
LLTTLDLEPLATRTASTLSGGQRRRLDIAIGMVHRPQLLFLDEPSTGLDPQNRAHLAEHIRRLHREFRTTIFLTTHYLDEADALAERVLIIDHGTMIADDNPERLKADLAGDQVTVEVGEEAEAAPAAEIANKIPGVHEVTADGPTVRIRATGGDAVVPELVLALAAAGVQARAVDLHRPTLDDVFLVLTGRSLRVGA